MNIRDAARDRLIDRYTVLRSDPFIVDAAVYMAMENLAVAMRDQHQTRRAWEDGSGTPHGPHLERMHRLAWRDLLDKVEAAEMAAGFDMALTGEPQSVVEARGGVVVQTETMRRSDDDDGVVEPGVIRHSTEANHQEER